MARGAKSHIQLEWFTVTYKTVITTAAVILESIPATLGMPIPSPGYLAGVERLCRERGAAPVPPGKRVAHGTRRIPRSGQTRRRAAPGLETARQA